MSDDDKLSLCRKYFWMGWLCLPLLWLINVLWFFPSCFFTTNTCISQEHKTSIRFYVIASLIGVLIWTLVGTAWILTFQLKRTEWQEWADDLSFNIPRGIA